MRHFFISAKLTCDGVGSQGVESHTRFRDTPWEYLESEGTDICCYLGVILDVRFSIITMILFSFQSTLNVMDPDLFGLITEETIKVVYLLKRPGRPA